MPIYVTTTGAALPPLPLMNVYRPRPDVSLPKPLPVTSRLAPADVLRAAKGDR